MKYSSQHLRPFILFAGIALSPTAFAVALAPATPVGAPIVVGSLRNVDSWGAPSIASDAAGNFVVTWMDLSESLVARRYHADGTPVGDAFTVRASPPNDDGHYLDYSPHVAMNASGGFVIAWYERDPGLHISLIKIPIAGPVFWYNSSRVELHVQSYGSNGQSLSGDIVTARFRTTDAIAATPSVAIDAAGDFALSWVEDLSTIEVRIGEEPWYTFQSIVHANSYSPSGKPLRRLPMTVDTRSGAGLGTYLGTVGMLIGGDGIAMDAAGNFSVVWETFSFGDKPATIYVRSYSLSGRPLGSVTQANIGVVSLSFTPLISMNESGRYAVAWGCVVYSTCLRAFAPGGTPATGEINATDDVSIIYYLLPAIAIGQDGSMVMAESQPNGQTLMRLFSADGAPKSASTPLPIADMTRTDPVSVTLDPTGAARVAYAGTYDPALSTQPLLVQQYVHP